MTTTAEPAGTPQLGPQADLYIPNRLYPVILAAVLLCSILITIFTAARLITIRLVSTYNFDDCELDLLNLHGQLFADACINVDFLIVAYVSTQKLPSARASLVENKQVFNIAFGFTLLAAGRAGLGQHLANLKVTEFPLLAKVARSLLLFLPDQLRCFGILTLRSTAGHSKFFTAPRYGWQKQRCSSN